MTFLPFKKFLILCGEALLRLIYPAFCTLCHEALTLEERRLCGACVQKLERLALSKPESHQIFKTGVIREHLFLYAYKDELKALWAQVKFGRRAWLLSSLRIPLKKFLLAVGPETRYDCLVPVPINLWRRLERHYNQAELLAEEISRLSGLPVVKALKKTNSTRSQRQLSREERQSNLRGSLAVKYPATMHGRSVLIVDDVFTTGATARECARILRQAGAKKIGIFALAYTPTKHPKGSDPQV